MVYRLCLKVAVEGFVFKGLCCCRGRGGCSAMVWKVWGSGWFGYLGVSCLLLSVWAWGGGGVSYYRGQLEMIERHDNHLERVFSFIYMGSAHLFSLGAVCGQPAL